MGGGFCPFNFYELDCSEDVHSSWLPLNETLLVAREMFRELESVQIMVV